MSVSNPVDNLSYTNKDFQTIYPELLDVVKKLTYKWDPTISNESDPGVILIKLNAIIADKNNYNIDKNILECFPDTVTQIGNAYKLFSQLGYNMEWYKSASGYVSIRYSGDADNNGAVVPVLPLFKMLSDEDNEIVYTTVERKELPLDKSTVTVKCIQGVVRDYTVANSKVIKLNALDGKNRLYFPVSNVAENGIFITNAGTPNSDGEYEFGTTGEWNKSDNLHIESLSTKCYYFGVDQNTNRCYIEFPMDIGTLIGNGLLIKYIQSDGESGNIPAFKITKFYDDFKIKVADSEIDFTNSFDITNQSYITNGRDPETISEAYSNYKKLVGTFDTLVTLRDYINYITQDDFELVSNGVVSDRTNDIQSSYKIMNTIDGVSKPLYAVTDAVEDDDSTPSMGAFDLRTYFLKYSPFPKFSTETDSAVYVSSLKSSYDKSFEFMLSDEDGHPLGAPQSVKNAYSQSKSIQHDFIDKEEDSLLFFKNVFDINLTIIPKSVVTRTQRDEIHKNVNDGIYRALQSKNISFGEEIAYETLYDICVNSDDRIKAIALDGATYKTIAVVYSSEEGKLIDIELPTSVHLPDDASTGDGIESLEQPERVALDVVAKNVLCGTTPMFEKNNRYSMNVGQSVLETYDRVEKVSTNTDIKFLDLINSTGNNGIDKTVTLLENESVVFYAPNLIEKAEYSVGIKYVYYTTGEYVGPDSAYIPSNKDYVLQPGQCVFLFWKDEDSQDAPYLYSKYGSGTILNSTTKLYAVGSTYANTQNSYAIKSQLISGGYEGDGQIFGTLNDDIYSIDSTILSATKKVTIKEMNVVDLNDTHNCYWITNKKWHDDKGDEFYVMSAKRREGLNNHKLVRMYGSNDVYVSNFQLSSADGIKDLSELVDPSQDYPNVCLFTPTTKSLRYLDKDNNVYYDTVTTYTVNRINDYETEPVAGAKFVETNSSISNNFLDIQYGDITDIVDEYTEYPSGMELAWNEQQVISSSNNIYINSYTASSPDVDILFSDGSMSINIEKPVYVESLKVMHYGESIPKSITGFDTSYSGGYLKIYSGAIKFNDALVELKVARPPSSNISSTVKHLNELFSSGKYSLSNGRILNYYESASSGELVPYKYTYTLKPNEYFIYTDKDKRAMSILGMGTGLTTTKYIQYDGTSDEPEESVDFMVRTMDVDYEDVISSGLSAFEDTMWYNFVESRDGDVVATENRIISVGQGSQLSIKLNPVAQSDSGGDSYLPRLQNIKFSGDGVYTANAPDSGQSRDWLSSPNILDNYTIKYRRGASASESWETLPSTQNGSLSWDAYSVLDINSGMNNPQTMVLLDSDTSIVESDRKRQSITVYNVEGDSEESSVEHLIEYAYEDVYDTFTATSSQTQFQLSRIAKVVGGKLLDGTVSVDDTVTEEYSASTSGGVTTVTLQTGAQQDSAISISYKTDGSESIRFQTSSSVTLSGGDEIDTTSKVGDETKYLGFYFYHDNNYIGSGYTIKPDGTKYKVTIDEGVDSAVTVRLSIPVYGDRTLIPIEFSSSIDGGVESFVMVEEDGTSGSVIQPLSFDDDESIVVDGSISSGTYYYNIVNNSNNELGSTTVGVSITITPIEDSSIPIGGMSFSILPLFINKENTSTGVEESLLLDEIARLNVGHKFDYTYQPDSNVIIERPLTPASFFNSNHFYNRYVISKINNSNIKTLNVGDR